MNSFIIFDVNSRTDELKALLRTRGYYTQWAASGNTFNLPANSMWKLNCELSQAKSEIQSAINSINANGGEPIILLRLIIVSNNPWDGITGQSVT